MQPLQSSSFIFTPKLPNYSFYSFIEVENNILVEGKCRVKQVAKNILPTSFTQNKLENHIKNLKKLDKVLKNSAIADCERHVATEISKLVSKTSALVDKIKKRSMIDLVLAITGVASCAIFMISTAIMASYAIHIGGLFVNMLPVVGISAILFLASVYFTNKKIKL